MTPETTTPPPRPKPKYANMLPCTFTLDKQGDAFIQRMTLEWRCGRSAALRRILAEAEKREKRQ